MTGPADTRGWWEEQGEALSPAIDGAASVAVVGSDTRAAAQVALGIARAQSRHRRVALGDLVGEEPTLQSLVPDDLPHGLIDSFLYGVSLNRVAHPVDESGNLFILPSGPAPLDHDALMRSDRWRRLGAGFREVGALLMVVVSASTPGLDDLLASLDGVVRVGEVRFAPTARVLASALEPPSEAPRRRPPRVIPPSAEEPAPERPGRRWLWITLAVLLLALVGAWLAWGRPAPARSAGAPPVAVSGDTGATAVAPDPSADAPMSDSALAAAAALASVVNPDDSATAAAWVVALASYDREDDAATAVRRVRDVRRLPAATVSPVIVDGMQWYRVTVGSFGTREGADSLLASLRRQRMLEPEGGRVVYAPFTVRLGDGPVPGAQAEAVMARLREGGRAPFALRQPEENVIMYAGAFERAEHAAALRDALADADVRVAVAYRVGRVP